MIQLNPDCLIFRTASGDNIPCSAELVTIELMGDAVNFVDPEIIRNASSAVLQYFRKELGRESVTVAEFSEALEKVLRGFGFSVAGAAKEEAKKPSERVAEADLSQLASAAGKGFELIFYANLRGEVRRGLQESADMLRFRGLRDCVKHMTGARRWCDRCEKMSDQIVEYLRTCLTVEPKKSSCALVVW
jgi:hypothetical protein